MPPSRPPRPSDLIDALDDMPRGAFEGTVWRVVRSGRDALQGARSGGRWDDGTFDVLYCSLAADGAVAEAYFHLSKGQPVFPSRPKYFVHELEVRLSAVLDLSDGANLTGLGIDMAGFGRLSYVERQQEYPTTQEIAEVAHFLEYDGVKVPNARWQCANLIVFTGRTSPANLKAVGSDGPLDWAEWAGRRR